MVSETAEATRSLKRGKVQKSAHRGYVADSVDRYGERRNGNLVIT